MLLVGAEGEGQQAGRGLLHRVEDLHPLLRRLCRLADHGDDAGKGLRVHLLRAGLLLRPDGEGQELGELPDGAADLRAKLLMAEDIAERAAGRAGDAAEQVAEQALGRELLILVRRGEAAADGAGHVVILPLVQSSFWPKYADEKLHRKFDAVPRLHRPDTNGILMK